MSYGELIERFMYEALPSAIPATATVRFEAIAAALVGTKQRRFGPQPSPEALVAMRDVLRQCLAVGGSELHIFLPWGCCKQDPDARLDILEVMALRQLACLAEDVLMLAGPDIRFHIRLEDLGDLWLLGEQREPQVRQYVADFANAGRAILGDSLSLHQERDHADWSEWKELASHFQPRFASYLRGNAGVNVLREMGWQGTIPEEQREHYIRCYAKLYPGADGTNVLARYFAGTLARVKLGAVCAPTIPHVKASFAHPVPGDPGHRLYWRTLPERYTNNHRAPWLSRGYFAIHEDDSCVPKSMEHGTTPPNLTDHFVLVGGKQVPAPYVLL